MSKVLLKVENLSKHYLVRSGWFSKTTPRIRAVDRVNLCISKGETLGLVGESGCGKTTLGRTILKLVTPTSGKVIFDGTDISQLKEKELRALRPRLQIIFQDPFSSLNPRIPVGEIIGEAMRIHRITSSKTHQDEINMLLDHVGLPKSANTRYPYQFSGGQRQRIGIARALAVRPQLIVCDEAVSALDVSMQAQIINLLVDLQNEFGLSYLFISHDLNLVRYIADRIAVMYLGRLVEVADTNRLFSAPQHPYTQALIASTPIPDPSKKQDLPILDGEVPSSLAPPSGCTFHPRCPKAIDICSNHAPPETSFSEPTPRQVWCHLAAAGNQATDK